MNTADPTETTIVAWPDCVLSLQNRLTLVCVLRPGVTHQNAST